MAEFNALTQTIAPGESVLFAVTPVPDRGIFLRFPTGFLRRFWTARHREGSGNFLLNGNLPLFGWNSRCCCDNEQSINYPVEFHGNIAIPTGGTVGEISLAVTIDGATEPASVMTVTPAAVEQFFNVGTAITAEIWQGCCETVSVRNISDQPVLLSNGTLIIGVPNLSR